MMRAARLTVVPKKSLSRSSTTPVCIPQRTQGDAVRLRGIGKRHLQVDGRVDRVTRIGERGNRVARHLDERAAVRFDGMPRKGVVAGERDAHPLRLAFPKARAALDVGEERS
jgi:hypothetical protein